MILSGAETRRGLHLTPNRMLEEEKGEGEGGGKEGKYEFGMKFM